MVMADIIDSIAAHHNHDGRMLYLEGHFEKAVPYFEAALLINPHLWEAHYNLAHSLAQLNLFAKAAYHYQAVLQLHPTHPTAIFNLNVLFEQPETHHNLAVLYLNQNNKALALIHFEEALRRDLNNDTARHMVMALSGEQPNQAPKAYIADLFDQYATHYNQHMKSRLAYQAPGLLRCAIGRILSSHAKACRILDLGCGTGLCGIYFRDMARELIGVDISSQMIREAEKLNGYEKLIVSEMNEYLNEPALLPFDLIVAADVLVYNGSLDILFHNIKNKLTHAGYFAFTVEDLQDDASEFSLQLTGRYAHRSDYIHTLAKAHELHVVVEENVIPRHHNDQPVLSKLFILKNV